MMKEKFSEEQAAIVAPLIEKLLTMIGAARDAFNRHSRDRLQELQSLQGAVTRDLGLTSRQIKSLIARKSAAEQQVLLRLEAALGRLGAIDANLGSLAAPLRQKIQGGVLFSDKAVAQTNQLFDQHAGMVRSLLDIVKTDNQFLKTYVQNEGRNLIQSCADYATEHESRLIEGVCTPQAAPIFLAILETMRKMGQTEVEIAKILAEKP